MSPIYGVSRERVRQIEVRALERLQGMAKKDFKAMAGLQEDNPSISIRRKPKKPRVAIPSIPSRPKANTVTSEPSFASRCTENQVTAPTVIKSTQPNLAASSMEIKLTAKVSDKINSMVKKLRGLDISEEEYPYIPKSVGEEECIVLSHNSLWVKKIILSVLLKSLMVLSTLKKDVWFMLDLR